MTRQIRLLTNLSLRGLFGINEFLHTKDRRRKIRGCLMGVLWIFLILMVAGYVCILSYGLLAQGLGEFVPAVLGMAVAALVFFFTVFKAGAVLFDRRAYEKEIPLPVTVRAVILSRFLSMYVTDMLLGMVVMLPGMALYGIMERPGIVFYVYGIVAVVFLPLLPLTAASVVGAVIAGITVRWRRKNFVGIFLTLAFVCAVMVGSMQMSVMEESQLEAMMQNVALQLEGQIRGLYPPAMWMAEAMAGGSFGKLALFLGVSLGTFAAFLEILRPFYEKICTLLAANGARGNYRMKELHARSAVGSLMEREWRRYFSSTVYVTNTLVGQILMVFLAVGILAVGKDGIGALLGIPGITDRMLPVALGLLPGMMPLTACSVSMEGRQWWILQTLPVSRREMIRSKVGLNLLITAPFYVVSEVLMFIALKPGWTQALSLLAVPAAYCVFSARVGLAINEKMPVFDWENETRVVKQSASSMITMLVDMAAGVAAIWVLAAFPDVPGLWIHAGLVCVLLGAVWVMDRMGGDSLPGEA
ncbi:MAG: hypothetical protein HFH93_02065 [Lachnospiraceae bacterium]|nr:hypothetical protein [Lachnospiraceae bacterium]